MSESIAPVHQQKKMTVNHYENVEEYSYIRVDADVRLQRHSAVLDLGVCSIKLIREMRGSL